MRFSLDGQAFAAALAKVEKAAARRSSVAILGAVRIHADGDSLYLTCTDMEVRLTVIVPADVRQAGTAVVPARALVQLVKSYKGTVEVATIEDAGTEGRLSVTCGGSGQTFEMFDPEDFPLSAEWPDEPVATMQLATLAGTFGRVSHALSKDWTRPILTGVKVTVTGGALRLSACDSYRLAVETVDGVDGVDSEMLVPGVALGMLAKVAKVRKSEPDPAVTVSRSESYAFFRVGSDLMMTARLIVGQYPDVDRLRPEDGALTGTYEPEVSGTVAALRRLDKVGASAPVRVRLDDDGTGAVGFRVLGADVEASETVPGSFVGDPMEIGFRGAFLADAIESLDAEHVDVRVINPMRPALITNGKPDCWRLVMPIRLAG